MRGWSRRLWDRGRPLAFNHLMLGRIIKTKEARVQWISERMTKELTALAPSTRKIKVGAPRERESTRYGLDYLPCLSSTFSADVDLEGRVR